MNKLYELFKSPSVVICFHFLGYELYFKKVQTVFQSGCTILHSYHQCGRVSATHIFANI